MSKLPEMNGFQLYSEMKKIDSHIKALFVTAGNFEGEKEDKTHKESMTM
jgi:CheY-like chemotaxis protein